jgi:hypothetical protein
MPTEPEHWMLFGTFAQQDFFEYPNRGNTYEGVILNANMVAHAPAGIAAFLQEKRAGNKYIIDPLTHAFQHDSSYILGEDGNPKSSIRSLAEHYGEPITGLLGVRPLLPSDLDEEALRRVVHNCAKFQWDYLPEAMKTTNAAKYLGDDAPIKPYAIVAPYFYLTEATLDSWLPCCLRAVTLLREESGSANARVFASVVVSQGVLVDREARDKIVNGFAGCEVDGFLLWVDDLDELTAGKQELLGLLALCRGLRRDGAREVINLHGGYFSVLASGAPGAHAMTGVAHGPEFGEYRPVVPVGGGIPIARYYVPKLHARVRYRDAARWFNAQNWLSSADAFHNNVCNCEECISVLAGDPARYALYGDGKVKTVKRGSGLVRIEFPTRETTVRCLKHYLQRKHVEYLSARAPRDTLLGRLTAGASEYERVAGLEGVAHLRLWALVFETA